MLTYYEVDSSENPYPPDKTELLRPLLKTEHLNLEETPQLLDLFFQYSGLFYLKGKKTSIDRQLRTIF